MSVCVYCGSRVGNQPVFADVAAELGRSLASHKIPLIFGGGAIGLMGITARAVIDHGGHVTGVIPKFLRNREIAFEGAQELIITDDMHSRKTIMFEKANAFIGLPGGIGTLEEITEVTTWQQLGRHEKPIILLNTENFWQPFISLLEHMKDLGFIDESLIKQLHIVASVKEALDCLERAIKPL